MGQQPSAWSLERGVCRCIEGQKWATEISMTVKERERKLSPALTLSTLTSHYPHRRPFRIKVTLSIQAVETESWTMLMCHQSYSLQPSTGSKGTSEEKQPWLPPWIIIMDASPESASHVFRDWLRGHRGTDVERDPCSGALTPAFMHVIDITSQEERGCSSCHLCGIRAFAAKWEISIGGHGVGEA